MNWTARKIKRFRLATLALAAVLVALISGCSQVKAQPLGPKDFVLGPVKYDMSAEELIKALGEPETKTPGYVDGETWNFGFGKPEAEVVNGKVLLVSGVNESRRGLKVGDDIAKAVKLYGEPAEKYEEFWLWYFDGREVYFSISIKEGKVTAMSVGASIYLEGE